MNIVDSPRKWSELTPDKDAIIDWDRNVRVSFSELLYRAEALASGLSLSGLKKGDRVAILSTNRSEYFEIYYACALAGFIAQPINWRLAAEEISRIKGYHSSKISEILGYVSKSEVVHKDDMVEV